MLSAPAETSTKIVHTLSQETITQLSKGLVRIAEDSITSTRKDLRKPKDLVPLDFGKIIKTHLKGFETEELADVITSTKYKDLRGKTLPNSGYFIQGFETTAYEDPIPRVLRVRDFTLVYYKGSDKPRVRYWDQGREITSPVNKFFSEPTILVSNKDTHKSKDLIKRICDHLQERLADLYKSKVEPRVLKEKERRNEQFRARLKRKLIVMAGNPKIILGTLTREKLVYFHGSEFGDDLHGTFLNSANDYIIEELVKLKLATKMTKDQAWADYTRLAEVGSWDMLLARKVYSKDENGDLINTGKYTLTGLRSTDIYTSELLSKPLGQRYIIINEGVDLKILREEIMLAGERHESAVVKSIAMGILRKAGQIVKEYAEEE